MVIRVIIMEKQVTGADILKSVMSPIQEICTSIGASDEAILTEIWSRTKRKKTEIKGLKGRVIQTAYELAIQKWEAAGCPVPKPRKPKNLPRRILAVSFDGSHIAYDLEDTATQNWALETMARIKGILRNNVDIYTPDGITMISDEEIDAKLTALMGKHDQGRKDTDD